MYEIPVHTRILTRCYQKAKNSYITLITTFGIIYIFGKYFGRFRPESSEIQFPVPVKPEPKQEFEIPVPD
jgi:hypothetical protein